jgi:nucleotide-binding universal stress UspA family protein
MAKRKVLLALDGSDFGRMAFRTVGRLFDPETTHVTIAHVAPIPEGVVGPLPPPSIVSGWSESALMQWRNRDHVQHPMYQSQAWVTTREEVIDAFDDDVQRLADAGYEVSLAVRFGDPAQELADLVDEEGVDAVVIATHGRSGLSRAVLGSVAERLLRMVLVPVIMVRPHDVGIEPTPLAPFA